MQTTPIQQKANGTPPPTQTPVSQRELDTLNIENPQIALKIPGALRTLPGAVANGAKTALYGLNDDRNIWRPTAYVIDFNPMDNNPMRTPEGAAQTVWFEAAKLAFLGTTSRELTKDQEATLQKVLASMKDGETKWSEQQRKDFFDGAGALARRSQYPLENRGVGLFSREDRRHGSQSFAEDARLLLLRVDPKALERFDDDEVLTNERKLAQEALAGFALANLTEKDIRALFPAKKPEKEGFFQRKKVTTEGLLDTIENFIAENGQATRSKIEEDGYAYNGDGERYYGRIQRVSGLEQEAVRQLLSEDGAETKQPLNDEQKKKAVELIAEKFGSDDEANSRAEYLLELLVGAAAEFGLSESVLVQRMITLLPDYVVVPPIMTESVKELAGLTPGDVDMLLAPTEGEAQALTEEQRAKSVKTFEAILGKDDYAEMVASELSELLQLIAERFDRDELTLVQRAAFLLTRSSMRLEDE